MPRMPPSILDRARKFVTLLLMAAGGAFVLAYLYVATSRMGYPHELEWMEGGLAAFWTSDLLPALPIATSAAVLYAASRVRAEGGRGRFFYPLLAALG